MSLRTGTKTAASGTKNGYSHEPRSKGRMTRGQSFSINATIIRTFETGSLQGLLAMIEQNLPMMNLVNLSTALHRLTKLTAKDTKAIAWIQHHCVLRDLLSALLSMYDSVDAAHVETQSLSNNSWAIATLQIANEPLLLKVVEIAALKIAVFKPFELATLLWGLAKVLSSNGQQKKSRLEFPIHALFQTAANQIITQVEQFEYRNLATISWAFATAQEEHGELFQCMGAKMVKIISSANTQEMSNTAWAFGTAQVCNGDLFSALANQAMFQLSRFKPQELSNMIWAFGTSGFFHEEFYARAFVRAQHMDLQSQHLANIIWAYARVRPNWHVTRALINAMLPICTKLLETFKPQEVVAVVQAVARACGANKDVGTHADQCNSHVLPKAIYDFFACVLPWTSARLAHLPARMVANILSSTVLMDTYGNLGLEPFLQCMESKVLGLLDSMEPASLLHLLNGLACSPPYAESRITAALYAKLGNLIGKLNVQSFRMLCHIAAKQLNCKTPHGFTAQELRKCCFLLAEGHQNSATDVESSKLATKSKKRATACAHPKKELAEASMGQQTLRNGTGSNAVGAGMFSAKPASDTERWAGAPTDEQAPAPQGSNSEGPLETSEKLDGQETYTEPSKQGTSEFMTCRISVKNSFFHIEDDNDDDDVNDLTCARSRDGADREPSQRSTSAPSRTVSDPSSARFWWGVPHARQLPVVELPK